MVEGVVVEELLYWKHQVVYNSMAVQSLKLMKELAAAIVLHQVDLEMQAVMVHCLL